MRLKRLLIVDPKVSTAERIADGCDRLAEERIVATTAKQALDLNAELVPETVILSLELSGTTAVETVSALKSANEKLFVIATYREMSVPEMARLGSLGVEDFVPQPIDMLQIYRAASRRFNVPFRRHDRFSVTLEILRADGVLIGRTVDISEGGMMIDAIHPIDDHESILVDVMLESEQPLRVRCSVLQVDGQPPAAVRARVQFVKLWGPEQQRLLDFLQTL